MLSVVKFLAENEDKAHEKEMSRRPLSHMQLTYEHPQGLHVIAPAHRTPSRSFMSTKDREKQEVKSNKDGKDQLASNWYKTHHQRRLQNLSSLHQSCQQNHEDSRSESKKI
ncbi:hypothetical protein ACFX2I_043899 [Malus domestica]